jgi:hypothetical protein
MTHVDPNPTTSIPPNLMSAKKNSALISPLVCEMQRSMKNRHFSLKRLHCPISLLKDFFDQAPQLKYFWDFLSVGRLQHFLSLETFKVLPLLIFLLQTQGFNGFLHTLLAAFANNLWLFDSSTLCDNSPSIFLLVW